MGFRAGRSADRHPFGLYLGRTVPVGPLPVLRLALSVRCAPEADQYGGAEVPDPPDPHSDSVARAGDRRVIPSFSVSCGRLFGFMVSGHGRGEGGPIEARP